MSKKTRNILIVLGTIVLIGLIWYYVRKLRADKQNQTAISGAGTPIKVEEGQETYYETSGNTLVSLDGSVSYIPTQGELEIIEVGGRR